MTTQESPVKENIRGTNPDANAAINLEKENLERLSRTKILPMFVQKHQGEWDHQTWMELCDELAEKGYTPIEFDQVGMLLEEKKSAYLKRINLIS